MDRKPARVDPIEYFVTEQRAGHCEYFASALVMMLRSQEIPARLVLGFRGGEYNAMGHYFLVRQLHAHAWVEVYLGPDQVDENMLLEGESSRMGAWMTLDPTPGNDSIVALSPAGWRERWSHLGDFLELLWKDYVVGLDSNRQRKAIYVPLVESTSASIRDVIFNPEWWRVFVADLIHRMGLDSVGNFRKQWINWRSVPLLAAPARLRDFCVVPFHGYSGSVLPHFGDHDEHADIGFKIRICCGTHGSNVRWPVEVFGGERNKRQKNSC